MAKPKDFTKKPSAPAPQEPPAIIPDPVFEAAEASEPKAEIRKDHADHPKFDKFKKGSN